MKFWIALAALALGVWAWAQLELHFFDVGQGDALLLRAPSGQVVLIDGGASATHVRDLLEALGVTAIDLLIASHHHADHIGGLPAVVTRFAPRFWLENGVPATTRVYERLLQALIAAESQLLEPGSRRITLGEVVIQVLPAPVNPAWGQNNNSVGVLIEYGDFRASAFGDAEERLQGWWLREAAALLAPVQVHKASHHGSRAGDTLTMLSRLSPGLVVMSVGEGNNYGHPHPEMLAMLSAVGAQVMRTDRQGTVVVYAERDGSYRVTFSGVPPPPVTGGSSAPALLPSPDAQGGCVDLNRASLAELERVRHIGSARARAIVVGRPWQRLEELTRIDGIGPARLADILTQGIACVRPVGP